MASGIQTTNGKAFEYACLLAIYNKLAGTQDIVIKETPQLRTAKNFYDGMLAEVKADLLSAASAATRVIVRLEPQLEYPDNNIPLFLSLLFHIFFFLFLL